MKTTLKTTLIAGAFAAFAATSVSAQMALPGKLSLSSASKVWFDGTSNVKSFSCAAKKLDLDIKSDDDASPAKIVKAASLVIPVAQIDCKNGKMNEHMRDALKAEKNPTILWKLSSYRVEGTSVVMAGTLTIAGKENPIELRGVGGLDNGTITVKGTKVLKMTEFGVKPPSLMFGTMKVADPVTVSFEIVLNQQ
jgi:polyisoprenoid-binding protein YceI